MGFSPINKITHRYTWIYTLEKSRRHYLDCIFVIYIGLLIYFIFSFTIKSVAVKKAEVPLLFKKTLILIKVCI